MASSSSPPLGPKPKSAVPSYLLNGSSPLSNSTSARDARERESLASSIRSSFTPRTPAEFDSPSAGTMSQSNDATSASGVARESNPARYTV